MYIASFLLTNVIDFDVHICTNPILLVDVMWDNASLRLSFEESAEKNSVIYLVDTYFYVIRMAGANW